MLFTFLPLPYCPVQYLTDKEIVSTSSHPRSEEQSQLLQSVSYLLSGKDSLSDNPHNHLWNREWQREACEERWRPTILRPVSWVQNRLGNVKGRSQGLCLGNTAGATQQWAPGHCSLSLQTGHRDRVEEGIQGDHKLTSPSRDIIGTQSSEKGQGHRFTDL